MSDTSRLCTSGNTGRIAVLTVALVVGWAGPSWANDPGPASDVSMPEQAPPDPEPGFPQPDSHVHDVGQPPDRFAREVLKDIWTRDTLTGDWRGLRTDPHDHGIDIGLRLSQYGQGVASGGVEPQISVTQSEVTVPGSGARARGPG